MDNFQNNNLISLEQINISFRSILENFVTINKLSQA